MSDLFYLQLQELVTPWLMHYWPSDIEVRQGAGWHFCFANLTITPAQKNRFYSFGELTDSVEKPRHASAPGEYEEHLYPSTEQFYGGNGQTQFPLAQIVSAASAEVEGSASVIIADANGRLWVRSGASNVSGTDHNHLGLGPFIGHMKDDGFLSRKRRNSRCALTPVYGEGNDLENVRFLDVSVVNFGFNSSARISAAIDSTGQLWFAGNPCSRKFAAEAQFPDDASGVLSYFRKAEFYSYIDASGTVTLESPLEFKKHVACRDFIIAIDVNDEMYIWGKQFRLGKTRESSTPHKVSGFVDSATVTNQGSGYDNFFGVSVTASDPDLPDGVRATFAAGVAGGKVVSIRVGNPGYGYLSPPTLTVTSNGGGGSGATCSATLFGDSWLAVSCRHLTTASTNDQYACVSSNGKLYVCGYEVLSNYDIGPAFLFNVMSPLAPYGQDASGYQSVSLHQSGGICLTNNGTLESWGDQTSLSPSGAANYVLTPISSAKTFASIGCTRSSSAALATDGTVFTYGFGDFSGRGTRSDIGFGQVPGDAAWTALFGTPMGIVLNRDESFDEYGNRIDPIPPGLT
jgi:hypothetical protein